MKKILYIFLFTSFVLVTLASYYFFNKEKIDYITGKKVTPTPRISLVDFNKCKSIDPNDYVFRSQHVDMIRKYFAEKEGVPLSTSFIGKMVEGSNCYSLKIEDFEAYEDKDENLVILKGGSPYKTVPKRNWKYL